MGGTWRDFLSIGALMNTRGLMELVVLNIGYEYLKSLALYLEYKDFKNFDNKNILNNSY